MRLKVYKPGSIFQCSGVFRDIRTSREANQIIGHFGLGFYSAFMVADKVQIDTLSWEDGRPVRWISETGMDYTMEVSDARDKGNHHHPPYIGGQQRILEVTGSGKYSINTAAFFPWRSISGM